MQFVRGIGGAFGDSGFSALANFAIGLYAVQNLDAEALALYSLFFTGWITTQLLPAQMTYLPIQIGINLGDRVGRPSVSALGKTGLLGILLAPALASLAGLPLIGETSKADYIATAVIVAGVVFIAPLNSHSRALLHIAGKHWGAAATSLTTFLITSAAVVVASFVRTEVHATFATTAFVFAIILVGQAVGATVGILILLGLPTIAVEPLPLRHRFGYLGPDLTAQASGYLVTLIVSTVLGASAVATLEAARIMTSPVTVVAAGLSSYIVPKVIRSFARGELREYGRRMNGMLAMILLTGLAYIGTLLLASSLVVKVFGAHASPSLGAARAAAMTIDVSASGVGAILFASGRIRRWNVVTFLSALIAPLALAPAVAFAGIYGVPIAQGIAALVRTGVGTTMARAAGRERLALSDDSRVVS